MKSSLKFFNLTCHNDILCKDLRIRKHVRNIGMWWILHTYVCMYVCIVSAYIELLIKNILDVRMIKMGILSVPTYLCICMYVPMYLIYAHMHIWIGYIRTYVRIRNVRLSTIHNIRRIICTYIRMCINCQFQEIVQIV